MACSPWLSKAPASPVLGSTWLPLTTHMYAPPTHTHLGMATEPPEHVERQIPPSGRDRESVSWPLGGGNGA